MTSSSKRLMALFLVIFLAGVSSAWAKKKKELKGPAQTSAVEARLEHLSTDEKRQFDALSDDQKKAVRQGKVEEGFNEWMVKLALGDPYSATEHHPVFVDYEQVWIYTRPDIQQNVTEEQFMDPQTNWPSILRKMYKKICTVGDFFVLFDRGVVQKIVPDYEHKRHGSCTVETSEAILPIVNGKPVEPVQPVEPK
ncbi:MAG: hypothetical protein HYU99_08985 [Deltaproteobacteria bacterium]|nr:hypothetical protein [Deltaproteobacteria bacterium]